MALHKKVNPTLVVGVGGTGKRTIMAIKRYIVENGAEGGLRKNYPNLHFLSFDSSTNTLENEAVSKYDGLSDDDIRIRGHEIVQLRSSLKDFDIKDYPELDEWFPANMSPFLGAGIFAQGCQQNRVLGRFLFAWNYYQVIEPALRKALNSVKLDFQRDGGGSTGKFHNVYLVGSLSGGTGSGMFLDMAYAIRKVWHEELVDQRTLQLYGFIPGPSYFTKFGATEYVFANHYGGLIELDYYMNLKHIAMSSKRFRMSYPGEEFSTGRSGAANHPAFGLKPFDYVFLFDDTNGLGKTIDMDACYEMMGGFIANMYGGELAEGYYDVNSNTSPELTKYAKNTGRPLAYSGMGMSTILFPRNVILQRLSEFFTIQLAADLLQTEVTTEAAKKVYEEHLTAGKSIYEWPDTFDAHHSRRINEQLDAICSDARTSLSYLDDEEDDVVFQDNIRNSLHRRAREFFDGEREALKSRFIEFFVGNVATIGRKLVSMDDQVDQGRGDISGALIFYSVVKEKLKDARADSGLLRAADVFEAEEFYDFEEDENPFVSLVRKIPGLNYGKVSSKEKWEEHLEMEIGRVTAGFWELIINEAIGGELSTEPCVLREINIMLEDTRAMKERFESLLKNLVPNCNPGDENDLRFIMERCREPIARAKPEGKPRFELINYDSPANPALYMMLWRVEDLHDFYHGNEALGLPGVVPIQEAADKDEKPQVKARELLERKREVLLRLLRDENLGAGFSKVAGMSVPRLKALMMAETRRLFSDQFARWDIEKAMNVMGSEEGLSTSPAVRGLEAMLRETDVFVQIKDGELGLAGVDGSNNSNNSMNFIFLPNLYAQRPCASIKNSGEKKCPAQEDPSVHCDKLGKCLKQVILNTTGKKISIIHPRVVDSDDIESKNYEWYQLHEIHILKVFHGLPLQSLEQQMSKGLPSYLKNVEEGRTMVIASPGIEAEYHDITVPFPSEERREYLRKILWLFAAGLLQYRSEERAYRFVTEKAYQRYVSTHSSLDYEGELALDEDLLLHIQDHPRIEGLVNVPEYRALFGMSDTVLKTLSGNQYAEAQFEMYLRLVSLERNPRMFHPSRDTALEDSTIERERDLIHDLLGKLRAIRPELTERYERDGSSTLPSIRLNEPVSGL